MIRELAHRRRMAKLTRQMARADARQRHPAGKDHPSPEQIERTRDMVCTMAGTLVHFAATPGVFPQFIDFLQSQAESVRIGDDLPEETVRVLLKLTHDMLAPGCPEPIEAM